MLNVLFYLKESHIATVFGNRFVSFLGYLLPVINRNEISRKRKAFKWLSIEYFLDFSTH